MITVKELGANSIVLKGDCLGYRESFITLHCTGWAINLVLDLSPTKVVEHREALRQDEVLNTLRLMLMAYRIKEVTDAAEISKYMNFIVADVCNGKLKV